MHCNTLLFEYNVHDQHYCCSYTAVRYLDYKGKINADGQVCHSQHIGSCQQNENEDLDDGYVPRLNPAASDHGNHRDCNNLVHEPTMRAKQEYKTHDIGSERELLFNLY